MNRRHYELIIIGGGRASTLAIEAGKKGKRVALIERGGLGGTCPNRGCVPSKLLIGYADAAHHIRHANRFYIDAEKRCVDIDRIFADTNTWISKVDARYKARLPQSVDLYRDHCTFLDNYTVSVDGTALHSEQIVVATGSRPGLPSYKHLPIWTSDHLFPLDNPPASIIIIGGGYIACELGSFFNEVGVETHLVVRGDRLLKQEDVEIAAIFNKEFPARVPTLFNTSVSSLSHDGKLFSVELEDKDKKVTQHTSEAVLFATGRIPNTDELGLQNTDIQTTERGFLKVNEHLESSVPGIYAAGDVAGNYMFQHSASFEVRYLIRKLLAYQPEPIDYGFIPHAVYSEPEVAGVGATEQQLSKRNIEYIKVLEPWDASARALAMKVTYPRTKMLLSPKGQLLGCHLIGPQASVLLHEVLPVMRVKNDVRVLADTIHIHPALSEVILVAAQKAMDQLNLDHEVEYSRNS